MSIHSTHEQFVAEARRFLHQARAKSSQLVIFPELTGLMLAPPLISQFKLGFIRRADEGSHPAAGFFARRLGQVSEAAADAMGGGFRGSLIRLLNKKSDELRDHYFEVFGSLAREYGTNILGGSLYVTDPETGSIRNRAYLFDLDGEVIGYQDKLHLAPDEVDLATPGTELSVCRTRFGLVGLLIGRDALYPELARLLAIQGADLIAGIAAAAGAAQGSVIRSALAVRAEENQVYAAVSFLLGPNMLGQANRDDYYGQSALLSPISLSGGDGVLVQTGTNRSEGLIAADLSGELLATLRQTGRFRPRQEMNLANLGPVLAEIYQRGLSLEEAVELHLAGPAPVEPLPEPEVELPSLPEAELPMPAEEPIPALEAELPVPAEEPVPAPKAELPAPAEGPVPTPDAELPAPAAEPAPPPAEPASADEGDWG